MVDCLSQLCFFQLALPHDLLGDRLFAGQPFLLGPKILKAHGVGIVGLLGLRSLSLQVGHDSFLPGQFFAAQLEGLSELMLDGLSDLCNPFMGEVHAHPQLLDAPLDIFDEHRPKQAICPPLAPAQAVEVWVLAAVAVGVHDTKAIATLPTGDGALQVMRMLVDLFLGLGPGLTNGPALLEHLTIHQGSVPPWVLHTFVDDHTAVVRILEDAFDMGRMYIFAMPSVYTPRAQAALIQHSGQLWHAPVA